MEIDAPFSSTTILDLNDDCLLEVFRYGDMFDLADYADVCTRFRGIAAERFYQSKFREIDFVEIFYRLKRYFTYYEDESAGLRKFSSVLRNFGGLLITIKVSKYYKPHACVELLNRYCCAPGTLNELSLRFCEPSDAQMRLSPPLFFHLRKLTLSEYQFEDSFLKMLPVWSPNLQELIVADLNNSNKVPNQFNGLSVQFPKLDCISFRQVHTMKNTNLTKFLELNPQLKSISLFKSSINISIFQSIAKYVPEIDSILYIIERSSSFIAEIPKCFDKLKKLKLLSFECGDPLHTASIFCEIAAAKVPLEQLYLRDINFDRIMDQDISTRQQYNHFLDNISKLTSLRTLWLEMVENLSASHILDICKYVMELTELRLSILSNTPNHNLSEDILLECIDNAKNCGFLSFPE